MLNIADLSLACLFFGEDKESQTERRTFGHDKDKTQIWNVVSATGSFRC